MPPRTRLSPDARRRQLVELGMRMLATCSLEELSVEEVARSAGISRGLFFHYFASKQDFYLAVLEATAADLLARTAPDTTLPPLDALRATINAFIDFVSENPDGYVALLRGAPSGDADQRAVLDATRTAMAQRLLHYGQLPRTPEIELVAYGWHAYSEEVIVRWLSERSVAREALVTMLADALVALILPQLKTGTWAAVESGTWPSA